MSQTEFNPVSTSDISLHVNGFAYSLTIAHHWTLLRVLREQLDLTAAKVGCDRGECGTCTVLLEGKPIYACQILAVQVGERPVVTVEGLGEDDKLDRIQQAFLDNDGAQCGYCTPGFLLSAKALLEANSRPTELEIREALSGNLCRCNAYGRILQSVRDSAGPAPRSSPVARTGK